MPIYTYRCPQCKTTEERIIRNCMNQIILCEKCKVEMQRQLTTANFHLKGTGFYATDSKDRP